MNKLLYIIKTQKTPFLTDKNKTEPTNLNQHDTVKKYFQDLLLQHIFFCQINFLIIYLVEITYYFEFLFQFNQLKILRQPRLLTFLS